MYSRPDSTFRKTFLRDLVCPGRLGVGMEEDWATVKQSRFETCNNAQWTWASTKPGDTVRWRKSIVSGASRSKDAMAGEKDSTLRMSPVLRETVMSWFGTSLRRYGSNSCPANILEVIFMPESSCVAGPGKLHQGV